MRLFLIAVLALSVCMLAPAQEPAAHPASADSASLPDAPAPQSSASDNLAVRNAPRNFLRDQEAIWTSPAHIRARDAEWLLPLAATTGVAFATDTHTMTQVVSRDPSFNQASVNASDVLVGSLIAVPVAVYGFGLKTQDEHARQAGYLTGESMVDVAVAGEVLKLVSLRELAECRWRARPFLSDGRRRRFVIPVRTLYRRLVCRIRAGRRVPQFLEAIRALCRGSRREPHARHGAAALPLRCASGQLHRLVDRAQRRPPTPPQKQGIGSSQ